MTKTSDPATFKEYSLIGGSRDGERVSIDDSCDEVSLVDLSPLSASFSQPASKADRFNGISTDVVYQRRYLSDKDGRQVCVFAAQGISANELAIAVLGE